MKPYKIFLFLCLLIISLPSYGAGEFIEGVKNEHTLMIFLGVGVLLLFSCVMALIFMLHQTLPAILKEKFEKEKNEKIVMEAQTPKTT